MTADQSFPWDEEVQVVVTVRVRADRDPAVEVGEYGRHALDAAMAAIQVGRDDLSRIDGFADLIGEAQIVDVEKYL